MPVTLMDRLPLPSLKVYTAGSVVLLSAAVYHAIVATSDPLWRANATLRHDPAAMAAAAASAAPAASADAGVGPAPALHDANATRKFNEHFLDVITFMMQEPLCMWTVVNILYCALAVFGFVVVRGVFGPLRVGEAARLKDRLCNYLFYKFIFVFGVINVQYMDEVLLWCSWFSLLGFMHLLAQLCKERFDYLSSSPAPASAPAGVLAQDHRWALVRLALLLGALVGACGALSALAAQLALPHAKESFAFMVAESVLVLVTSLHVVARMALHLHAADAAAPANYYTHLVFDSLGLIVETLVVGAQVTLTRAAVSLPALVLLLQLRHLLQRLHTRLKNHRLYTSLHKHMSQNYPMASREEVDKNQDNCAICWEPMKEARKLPCAHLFHNSCLCQWVQQDASCPTCRRPLAPAPAPAPAPQPHVPPHAPPQPQGVPLGVAMGVNVNAPPIWPRPNRLFHFDGSRYVSWLPSFSVEMTRVRDGGLTPAQLDAMARQVQTLFPQLPLALLVEDLSRTHSPDATVDNIIEGRLQAPAVAQPPVPPAPPAAAPPDGAEGVVLGARPLSPAVAAFAHAHAHSHAHSHAHLAPIPDPQDDEPLPEQDTFSGDASQRERLLRRRKQALVAAARERFLQRTGASGASGASGNAAGGGPS